MVNKYAVLKPLKNIIITTNDLSKLQNDINSNHLKALCNANPSALGEILHTLGNNKIINIIHSNIQCIPTTLRVSQTLIKCVGTSAAKALINHPSYPFIKYVSVICKFIMFLNSLCLIL